MSFLAKLYLQGSVYNVLDSNIHFYQQCDPRTNKPEALPNGGLFQLSIEATAFMDFLHLVTAPDQMCEGHIRFFKRDGLSKLTDYEFFDTYIVGYRRSYQAFSGTPAIDTLVFSPGILRIGDMVFEKPWKVTDLALREEKVLTQSTKGIALPKLAKVQWTNHLGQVLEKTNYGDQVNLEMMVAHAQGGSVDVVIEKEDGTEFEEGQSQLNFTEYLTDEGVASLSAMDIKEQWEDFKTADIDGLVAKVSHKGTSKQSGVLQVVPKPKIIVYFRPNDKWKGEFGFDWLRIGDTKLFGDNKYEDIISKQYKDSAHTKLEKNGNVYKGHFKKDPKQFEKLKKKYQSFSLPWAAIDAKGNKNPADYLSPWMSMYKNQEVKLRLVLDIQEKGDYLEFEDNTNFTITPKTIDVSGKKGTIKPKDEITIKCLNEFNTDETITIKACQKDTKGNIAKIKAGVIKVWANDKTRQKEKKVAFIEIKTPPMSSLKEKTPDSSKEKLRVEKYLKQALIKLHKDSDIVSLDLSTDKDFQNFIISKKVSATNIKDNSDLDAFLKKQLSNTFKKKYDNHFKAFYFAENGYHSSGGLLSGYSRFGADFVVVFASANNQTAAHEFLHSMNLAHSFSNSEASKHAEFTYEYKKTENLLDYTHHLSGHENDRCSLWYWQWIKANNSIK